MSFGTQKYSEALELAVNDAAKQGILVIASAGNNGNESIRNKNKGRQTIAREILKSAIKRFILSCAASMMMKL